MSSVSNKAAGTLVKKAAGPLGKVAKHVNPLDVIREICKTVVEYKIVVQQEKAKRDVIKAERATALERIKAQREILLDYLRRSFDERRENFEALVERLDDAIASGNTDQMAFLLQTIVQLAQSSPFRDIVNADAVRTMLADGQKPVEF